MCVKHNKAGSRLVLIHGTTCDTLDDYNWRLGSDTSWHSSDRYDGAFLVQVSSWSLKYDAFRSWSLNRIYASLVHHPTATLSARSATGCVIHGSGFLPTKSPTHDDETQSMMVVRGHAVTKTSMASMTTLHPMGAVAAEWLLCTQL